MLPDAFVNLMRNLRIADLVDMFLVACLLYLMLAWMRRSMSQTALRGIGVVFTIFTVLYLPARYFEMYLIERATEALFGVLLLVTVVVFQSDLRRMLNRSGKWLFSWEVSTESSNASTVDTLVEVTNKLAETSTGALIAIRGDDPWDHHLQGGVELDGRLSPPLLYSLFDHRTEGHDGALLMEGDQVTRFAVHLPLATHLPSESQYGGTRHTAALGLAEVCDAFVIVVSEERGTISVAQDGTITAIGSAAELKDHLGSFWQKHYREAAPLRESWWSRSSVQTAALSVAVSVLLWWTFAYSPETVYRSFDVPIEYHDVPSDWRVQGETSTAQVTLSGPDQAFRSIDPSQLAIAFSMSEPTEGTNELAVDRSNLDLPEELTLDGVNPSTIQVQARPVTAYVLPVSVPTSGELPDSLRLIGLRAEPDSVTVIAPRGSPFGRVVTEPVRLDSIRQTTALERPLVREDEMRFSENGSSVVTVHITVSSAADSTAGTGN
jgi:uncharacterized protein (TIGR00159 family)